MATYAFTDLHGQYELWRQIKEFCQPEDKLYFLGDAADRGSDGVRIMIELLADPRVTYLKGNHEYFIENFFFNNATEETLKMWTKNGGEPTQKALVNLSSEELNILINQIKDLPYTAIYTNKKNKVIFMSHSGYYVDLSSVSKLDRNQYKLMLLQDRDHIGCPNNSKPKYIDYIVHGHTPVQYIQEMIGLPKTLPLSPLGYDNGKIGLDLCSIASDTAALLNLDTLESILFTIKK